MMFSAVGQLNQTLRFCIAVLLASLLAIAMSMPGYAQQPWTQFRGPDGSGISENSNVELQIDPLNGAAWRTETLGHGWSSPVTDGNIVWMTAAKVTLATAEQKKQALADVQLADMKDVAGSVELLAIALDAKTGKTLHVIELGQVAEPKPIHPMNGYASPTPAIDGDRVVVHFGQYGTWCLDLQSGDVLWQRTFVVDDSVGPGSSPVIHQGNVILTCDGMDKQFVVAVSLATGETIWKTDRPTIDASNEEYRKSYSTPLLIQVDGKTQAVIPCAQWCVAYDPQTGQELWRVDHGNGFSVTPMPSFAGGKLIFSTGFMKAELIAVDPHRRGDVTGSHVTWRASKGGSRMSSMVTDESRIYSISDDGILTALRLSDGQTLYRERLGGKYSASPFRVQNRIVLANHDGEFTVFRTGDKFEELAKYEFDEQVMASPCVIDNGLLIRTASAVYRFEPHARINK
ncbi:outer membrane protein assembly factor BamB family protein [Rubripirellula reticaptiva]|uniref:Outer membrane biogenesis protein BamB n=1 Tax=Rubripirellula reticaptiva TaxID=2528013 RepID=A0A5C6EVR3_9BACT|nr:PQQ-binding-like beta-propeller repeat protein [Rubripirellula reticaptiva]TWU51746.1 outer membrane biogenesis protein BamB [Rubripirellula reticaptiva]